MSPSARLGGFKILKDVVRFSMIFSGGNGPSPSEFLRIIAEEKINLPYITCIHDDTSWGVSIIVEKTYEENAFRLIKETVGKIDDHSGSAILSVFPHKRKPEITGSLFEVFNREDLRPDSLANSPSAISVVLKEDSLTTASEALFEPFSFSAYRTPADWKLAQKGKEQLYKEVVASYQEQRPKVYGLEYHEGQALVKIRSNNRNVGQFGRALKEFARLDLNLTFLATGPNREDGHQTILFCLPSSNDDLYRDIIQQTVSDLFFESITPVAVFSMNGPHFGDRYGIASELFSSFERKGIDLLGLGCTIASISGVVPSRHGESTIHAIQECFEVPSVIRKESGP